MAIQYEFLMDATQPGLGKLWHEATDWGQNTLDKLGHWFETAPMGKPRIVIATDTESDQIVGQFRFMPSKVIVDGTEIRAVRPFGTIITPAMHKSILSRNPLDQPVIAMFRFAVQNLKDLGEQLIYMVPDPRWRRLFKMSRVMQTDTFPLWSLGLPLKKPFELGADFRTYPLESLDERVDELWEKSAKLYGCVVIRNAATLRWKLANADYTVTAVERDGELVGLAASRHKGDRQWLICDMLCAEGGDVLRATLAAASNVALEKSLTEEIHKVAILTTPLMESELKKLGFKRDSWDFPLAVQVLDDSIKKKLVKPSRWYISAND